MPITTDTEAVIEFNRLCPSSVCPTLSAEEVLEILDKHERGTLWEASTVYEIGDRVIPTLPNRNGHRYKLIAYTDVATDQMSDATQPSWSMVRDSQITDNHLIWQEDGLDWDGVLWDFTAAARDGWLLKSSKASLTSDVVRGELEIKSSQLFDHCMKMADRFQPMFVL